MNGKARDLAGIGIGTLAVMALVGCGTSGGGGGGFGAIAATGSAGAVGQACDAKTYALACSGPHVMSCELKTLAWQYVQTCPSGSTCNEVAAAAEGGQATAECRAVPTQNGGSNGGGGSQAADAGASTGGGAVASDASTSGGGAVATDAGSTGGGTGSLPSADAGSSSNPGGGPTTPAASFQFKGGFSANLDGQTYTVNYAEHKAGAALKHQLQSKMSEHACVPDVKLWVERADGTCRLDLHFKTGFDGVLELDTARFAAKAASYQDGVPIKTFPCAGWKNETHNGDVFYERVGGNAQLLLSLVPPPQSNKTSATVKGLMLKPTGTAHMKFGGKIFTLKLDGLTFMGNAQSEGVANLPCAKVKLPLPQYQLKDINPYSPWTGQSYGLSKFQGQKLAVLMGAGWCASCVAQAQYMQTVKNQLASQGINNVAMVVINHHTASSGSQQKAIAIPKGNKLSFSVLQSTTSQDAWKIHGGKKNDCFIYNTKGKMIFKHVGKATVNLTQFKSELLTYLSKD